MLTTLIIIAFYLTLHFIFKWADKPSKRLPNPRTGGKAIKAPTNVFELMYPKLED